MEQLIKIECNKKVLHGSLTYFGKNKNLLSLRGYRYR